MSGVESSHGSLGQVISLWAPFPQLCNGCIRHNNLAFLSCSRSEKGRINDKAQYIKHSVVPPLCHVFNKHLLSFCNTQGSVLGIEKSDVTPVFWKPRV